MRHEREAMRYYAFMVPVVDGFICHIGLSAARYARHMYAAAPSSDARVFARSA